MDAAGCSSSADVIFRTQVLRPFLHHPGVVQPGEQPQAFLKPTRPSHQPPARAASASQPSVQPFDAEVEEGAARKRRVEESRRESIPGQPPAWRRHLQRQPLRSTSAPRGPSPAGVAAYSAVAAHCALSMAAPPAPPGSAPQGLNSRAPPDPSGGPDCRRQSLESFATASWPSRSSSSSLDCRRRLGRAGPPGDDQLGLPEAPDDPRVHLPAHRIGDTPPRSPTPTLPDLPPGLGRPPQPSRKLSASSRSSPSLVLGAQKKPLHSAQKSGASDESGGHGKGPTFKWHPDSLQGLLPRSIHQRLHSSLQRHHQDSLVIA